MSEITVEQLEKKFPGEGLTRFAKIAELGGFGAVSTFNYGVDPSCALDLRGCLDPENKAVTAANKTAIKALLETKEVAKNDNGTTK